MSIKKNFLSSSILLISQYIIPMITFPYISRIFGIEKVGEINWIDNVINNFILTSTLGLGIIGIRECAKYKSDTLKLSKIVSELILIHIISTLIVSAICLFVICNSNEFDEHKNLMYIGLSRLIINIFLLEWFFKGVENFKYITARSIIIKTIYVILVFVFVKTKDDYITYYSLTCGITISNAIINAYYVTRYIKFTFTKLNIKTHIKSYITMGMYVVLTNLYTTFNVTYLGVFGSSKAVGSYTTALKIYAIVLGIFSALNSVMMPRLSSLSSENNEETFLTLVNKSINIVITFSIPTIIVSFILSPQIISIISGPGYETAITCLRTITPLILIVGLAQIFSNQILMAIKKDSLLTYTAMTGAVIGIGLNILLVEKYKEVGTSIVVLISETITTTFLYFQSSKYIKIEIPIKNIIHQVAASVPYFLICKIIINKFDESIVIVILSSVISALYFLMSQIFFIKNKIIINQIRSLLRITMV